MINAHAVAEKNIRNVMENKNIIKGTTFILMRPDGKVLMQHRDDGNGQKILYPKMWSLPGGRVEKGEDHIQTIIREIKEEYDINVTKDQCEFMLSYDHDGNVRDLIFLCRIEQDIKPKLLEGDDMEWMTFVEIEKLSLAWELNKILPKLRKCLVGK